MELEKGNSYLLKDAAAYGFIMMQGHDTINNVNIETPAIIRFGHLTSDEMFVTEDAAKEGVSISNCSEYDNIVMLKHFSPENPEMKMLKK